MVTKVTATELAKSLSDILNRVKYRGERFVIERNGVPIATLGPAAAVEATAPVGITIEELAARLGDLKFPGDGFADDLEEIQKSQPMIGPSPWES